MKRSNSSALAIAIAATAAACGGPANRAPAPQPSRASIEVASDFSAGVAIAKAHTCDGVDVSPPLRLTRLPGGTREVVVVMRDPDAPGGQFVHWELAFFPPTSATKNLYIPSGTDPPGTVLGRNSFGSVGYRGPCPPRGAQHRYRITAYALAQPAKLERGFSAADVTRLPAIATGTLVGAYARR